MCLCFICNVFVYLVTLWAHSLHLDALRAIFSPQQHSFKDLVIRNEPKYCTDRPVNDHFHAVIRSRCISISQCKRSPAHVSGPLTGLCDANINAALLIWDECLVPLAYGCLTARPCKMQDILLYIEHIFSPEINVFYQRNTLLYQNLALYCLYVGCLIFFMWFYVDSILQISTECKNRR